MIKRRGAGLESEGVFIPYDPNRYMLPSAQRIQENSLAVWGEKGAVAVVGRSPELERALDNVGKVAGFLEPVLITGESGSGKESLAQAIHLLGPRKCKPFIAVNCPQYYEGNLTASEFFGHVRGSFTGAVADRKGAFEQADGGTIFLDEVGDLPLDTQAMLLRTLASGQFYPVGSTSPKTVSVRVIAATNRDLKEMRGSSRFRADLFYRLSVFQVEVPPLRDREDDWTIIADYVLRRLSERQGISRVLSSESVRILANHSWPGNVRELMSIVTTGFAMADGRLIEPCDFTDRMESSCDSSDDVGRDLLRQMLEEGRSFWDTIHEAFLDRDLNRAQVRAIIRRAFLNAGGSYLKMLDDFGMPRSDYQRFMDFLRHHRLKP